MPYLERPDLKLHYLRPAQTATEPRERDSSRTADAAATSPASNPSAPRPPLLMLAGMASDSMSWQPLVKPLLANFDLILPDNRCSGRSQPAVLPCSRELMVADTLALLDHLGIERVPVVGHSMGGMLGFALAAAAPDRVSHLFVMSALPSVLAARTDLFDHLLHLRRHIAERDWFHLLFHFLFSARFFDDPDYLKLAIDAACEYPYKQSTEAFAKQVEGLHSFAAPIDLSAIHCPVTLATGESDSLLPPRLLTDFINSDLGAMLRPSQLLVENAAHSLHWEQPERVAELIRSEISGRPS